MIDRNDAEDTASTMRRGWGWTALLAIHAFLFAAVAVLIGAGWLAVTLLR